MEIIEYQTGEHGADEFEVMKESTAELMSATGAYILSLWVMRDIDVMRKGVEAA